MGVRSCDERHRGAMAKVILKEHGGSVSSTVSDYLKYHDDSADGGELRKTDYTTMINHYYDLATDFYEYGWGTSFHFATQGADEGFEASIARHEHYLALKMKLDRGMRVLDIGCGVGGPAREIARFAEVHVTGLNNNAYQVERANKLTAQIGMESAVKFVKGNFMEIPFPDNSFDCVYEIEATAHAPSKTDCYAEVMRVVKPGGYFASYEWCLTDKYDPENAQHRAIKKGIEEGDGLPYIATTAEVVEALEAVGWEVLEQRDLCKEGEFGFASDIPWYDRFVARYGLSLNNLQHTPAGRFVMGKMLRLLEYCRLVPAGTVEVQEFLQTAADNLVLGGQTGTFTPAFFTLARKPLE